jgi:repressor LexA
MDTREPLTPRQREVLRFLIDYIADVGWAPTLREICGAFEWGSTNASTCILRSLEKKGYIVRGPRTSRAIRVVKP